MYSLMTENNFLTGFLMGFLFCVNFLKFLNKKTGELKIKKMELEIEELNFRKILFYNKLEETKELKAKREKFSREREESRLKRKNEIAARKQQEESRIKEREQSRLKRQELRENEEKFVKNESDEKLENEIQQVKTYLTPFGYFCEQEEEKTKINPFTSKEYYIELNSRWQVLTDDEKAIFNNKAEFNKQQFQEENKNYFKTKESTLKKELKDE